MRQKSGPHAPTSEQIVKDIRRATRKHHAAEEKIRIVLEGLRGEYSIAELCRHEWFESAGVEVDEISAGLDFSDSDLALQAALQGFGVALASLPLVHGLFGEGKLVQVSTHALRTGHSWYAVSTSKELVDPITRNTWDWLAEVAVQQ